MTPYKTAHSDSNRKNSTANCDIKTQAWCNVWNYYYQTIHIFNWKLIVKIVPTFVISTLMYVN